MRQTFVGLLTFFSTVFVDNIKEMVLNPRLARDCHQGVDISCVFPSELNNTEEKQQVCTYYDGMKWRGLFCLCFAARYSLCVYVYLMFRE